MCGVKKLFGGAFGARRSVSYRLPSPLSPGPMRTLLSAALLVALAAPALAQSGGFMPYLGYNLESENVVLGVGYRFGVELPVPITLTAQPAVEYQFTDGDGVTVLQGDLNVIAEFSGSAALAPYAGAGLGLLYVDTDAGSDTELGLNALGGVVFNPTGFGRPFAQARYSFAGFDALTLQGGVILAF